MIELDSLNHLNRVSQTNAAYMNIVDLKKVNHLNGVDHLNRVNLLNGASRMSESAEYSKSSEQSGSACHSSSAEWNDSREQIDSAERSESSLSGSPTRSESLSSPFNRVHMNRVTKLVSLNHLSQTNRVNQPSIVAHLNVVNDLISLILRIS